MRSRWMGIVLMVMVLGALLNGCALQAGNADQATLVKPTAIPLAVGEKLRVVATTSIVGDVVANVGGEAIQLTTLMGPGQDPHSYQPTPQAIATIEKAHVVFINGLQLEESLEATINAAASKGQPVVAVSDGIQPRSLAGEHEHGASDPHVWFDPTNVKIWVRNIETTLSSLDPANAAQYQANAAAYNKQLDELDAYIRAQVAKIQPQHRKLVTDHNAFGYFCDRYGFESLGSVVPGISPMAESSASDLAQLADKIQQEHVPAIFVGTTVNPKMAQIVADETGAQVLKLYTGALGAPGSRADTYIGMMRADVDTIVQGLGQ